MCPEEEWLLPVISVVLATSFHPRNTLYIGVTLLPHELYWSVFFPASLEGKVIKVNIANTQDRKATGEES